MSMSSVAAAIGFDLVPAERGGKADRAFRAVPLPAAAFGDHFGLADAHLSRAEFNARNRMVQLSLRHDANRSSLTVGCDQCHSRAYSHSQAPERRPYRHAPAIVTDARAAQGTSAGLW